MEALLFSATWHMLALLIHKENSIDSIEEFLNVYSEAFEIIAKYVLKAYILFHACWHASKQNERKNSEIWSSGI